MHPEGPHELFVGPNTRTVQNIIYSGPLGGGASLMGPNTRTVQNII